MKKQFLASCIAILLIAACNNRERSSTSINIIDIAGALDRTVTFNVSDFGKTIRYIPLETTDDCLIGNNPQIKVLKDYIIITANKSCYSFSKKDGSFIGKIGRVDNDPEGYSHAFGWANEKEDFLFFARQPNNLIKYDLKGNYSGKVELTNPPGLASHFLITDSLIIGHYNELFGNSRTSVALFGADGQLRDTIPSILTPIQQSPNDIENINMLIGTHIYGNWSANGVIILNYRNNQAYLTTISAATLWKHDNKVRFKENYIDTIYTINGSHLEPYMTFDTGAWHWPEQERTDKESSHKRILPTYVAENDRLIFFQCIQGVHEDRILYNGLYAKDNGKTTLSNSKDAISDNLTGFLAFNPIAMSTAGEFVGLIEATHALEWMEEHPDTETGKEFAFLKSLTDDMNPIVVLVE